VIAPAEPLSWEAVLERWPTIRQSLASNYDDCNLSAWFSMKYANGWSTTPQARGTIFHRTAAEILRTMRQQNVQTIPRREALAILLEVCHQRGVPAEDIVRVPMRQMPELRMAVDKFAKDNQFSTHRIVDIERKLSAEITYADEHGEVRRRTITGTLDALLFDPAPAAGQGDGAIVIDWKDTWALPPVPQDAESQGYDDEELKGLSYHGYFQQRWYGYLVMRNYRNVSRVTLREFYPRKTKVRKATVHRHQMEDIEQEIAVVVHAMDRALMQGKPNLTPGADGMVDIDALGWWKPQPGKHCGFCNKPTACPIEEDVRVANGGAATSQQSIETWAARWLVADRIRKIARESIKAWVDVGNPPPTVRWSKGRAVLGWMTIKGGGRKFGAYTPDQSDRGGHADYDEQLMEAMREATARAKRERGVGPRRRGTRRRTPA
jgi:hypothetical protein